MIAIAFVALMIPILNFPSVKGADLTQVTHLLFPVNSVLIFEQTRAYELDLRRVWWTDFLSHELVVYLGEEMVYRTKS